MLKTRIEPLDRSITVMLEETLGPEARSAALASFARERLALAQQRNRKALGFVPEHDTYVDGRLGVAEESVKPDGTILYEFNLLNDLFVWIAEQLFIHAPWKSGRFAKSILFFADDKLADPAGEIPSASEYVFASAMPYSRKLERGYSNQAPDGLFEVIARQARRRYKGQATIRFSYVRIASSGGAVIPYNTRQGWSAKAISKGASLKGAAAVASRAMVNQRAERQPAIIIQL